VFLMSEVPLSLHGVEGDILVLLNRFEPVACVYIICCTGLPRS